MAGEVSYVEVPAADAEVAQRFWGSLLGWGFAPGNFPGYSMIDGAGVVAGLAGGDDSVHPRVFFTVDDVAASVARVRALGGTAQEPVQVPSGAFARCSDDQGVLFSLWQDA